MLMKCDRVGLKKKVSIALDLCRNENCNLNLITVKFWCRDSIKWKPEGLLLIKDFADVRCYKYIL